MGYVLNIENCFWWHDYCFGLLIRDDALFHFMVSIQRRVAAFKVLVEIF